MKLHILENRKTGGYVTFGSVWNEGEVTGREFVLLNEEGKQIPVQSSISAWWPDGSVKWAAHYGRYPADGTEVSVLPREGEIVVQDGIQIQQEKKGWRIDTGVLSLLVPEAGSPFLALDIKRQGKTLVSSVYPVMMLEQREDKGKRKVLQEIKMTGSVKEVSLEETGALQCVIRFSGIHREEDGAEAIPFIIRMYLFHGKEEIRICPYLFL